MMEEYIEEHPDAIVIYDRMILDDAIFSDLY
jgi:hypothetical protein